METETESDTTKQRKLTSYVVRTCMLMWWACACGVEWGALYCSGPVYGFVCQANDAFEHPEKTKTS